uniref:P2R1A-PPP2R2A-interacting phosphatase regulator 1-like n=1 Tax=Myxine glutinosa TaxID=7769 RepID=UPI00358EF6B6
MAQERMELDPCAEFDGASGLRRSNSLPMISNLSNSVKAFQPTTFRSRRNSVSFMSCQSLPLMTVDGRGMDLPNKEGAHERYREPIACNVERPTPGAALKRKAEMETDSPPKRVQHSSDMDCSTSTNTVPLGNSERADCSHSQKMPPSGVQAAAPATPSTHCFLSPFLPVTRPSTL